MAIDPRSGYCSSTGIYHSKRKPVPLPTTPALDVTTFLSTIHSNHYSSSTAALVDSSTGRQLSYLSLWRAVASVSSALSSPPFSIRKSHVVLLLSPNSLHFPVVSLSVLSLGAILTTTNPLLTTHELSAHLSISSPSLAFVTPELLPKLPNDLDIPIILLSDEIPRSKQPNIVSTIDELLKTEPVENRNKEIIYQDDPATLLFSSGTTGPSKAVVSTHRNLISMVQIIINRFRLQNSLETFLCTVPMFHIYGLAAFAVGLLGTGATIVVLSKFDIVEMLHAIHQYDVTYLPLVPPILVALANQGKALKLGKLRNVLSGGAPLGKELIESFREKYPAVTILQGYGLTESTGIGASTDTADESSHYGTAGLLSPNTKAKIVDPESGKTLPVNATGELWLQGPYIMKEYFKNLESTMATLNSEGWLRTGDLCYIDNDGYLFVVDRLKELIKYKGYQVPPAELEALLLNHPEVADAAVIPFPDEEVGQYPMAYVVRKSGSHLTGMEVMNFIAGQVAPYKKIRKVAFVTAIPKNASGKILRKDLIKQATSKL